MSKILKLQGEVNRKNKEIERLKARDNIQYSVKLDNVIIELESTIIKNNEESAKERFELKMDLAKCIKEKRKLEDDKK